MKALICALFLVASTAVVAAEKTIECEGAQPSVTEGLVIEDLVCGDGEEATAGQVLTVHYIGSFPDGRIFDSSVERGQPFKFVLGAGQVITGFDLGFEKMKIGGKRKLTIAPELAYGERGAGGGVISPNATIIFEVELLAVEPEKVSQEN